MKKIAFLVTILSFSLLQVSCTEGDGDPFGTGGETDGTDGATGSAYVNSTYFFSLGNPIDLGAVKRDGTTGLLTSLTQKTSTITVNVGNRDGYYINDHITVFFAVDFGFLSSSTCTTVEGKCSVTYTTGDLTKRPNDDTAQITTYVLGEEAFYDLNNNKSLDNGESFTDSDTPFIDKDHDDAWTAGVDIPVGAIPHQDIDGKFSGENCLDTTGRCSGSTLTYIYDILTINLGEQP